MCSGSLLQGAVTWDRCMHPWVHPCIGLCMGLSSRIMMRLQTLQCIDRRVPDPPAMQWIFFQRYESFQTSLATLHALHVQIWPHQKGRQATFFNFVHGIFHEFSHRGKSNTPRPIPEVCRVVSISHRYVSISHRYVALCLSVSDIPPHMRIHMPLSHRFLYLASHLVHWQS